MKISTKYLFYLWILVWLLLGLSMLSLGWAALVNRPLFSDGIYWTFEILNKKTFFFDQQFTRYTDILLQIPALIVLKFNLGETLALKLNNLSYSLNPIVSFLACIVILKKRRRLDLLIFPILCFATVTQTVMSVPFVLIPGLLSLLWPLFFLAVLPSSGFFYWFSLLLLNFGFVFEHEVGLIFIILLVFVKAFEFYSAPQKEKRIHLILFSIFSVTSIWMIYHVLQLKIGPQINFNKQLFSLDLDAFRICSLALIILFVLIFKKKSWIPDSKKITIILTLALVTALFFINNFLKSNGGGLFWQAYRARTWAVPLACFICSICFISIKYDKPLNSPKNTNEYALGLVVISLALLISLMHDLKLTSKWNKSMVFLKSQITEEPGCLQLSTKETSEKLLTNGFSISNLSLYSIVMGQEMHNKIGRVLFSEENLNFKNYGNLNNFCCLLREGQIAFGDVYLEVEPYWSYNLLPVIQSLNSPSSKIVCP